MSFSENQGIIETALGGGLCPLGYASRIDAQVASLMEQFSSALLLDIRLRARSRWYPAWNKSSLQAKWGERYVHEKRLGNVNYQYSDRPIQLLDPEAALSWIIDRLQQSRVLLLVCACQDYDRCHRKTVVEYILQRGLDIKRSSGMRFDVARGCYVGLCRRLDFTQDAFMDLSEAIVPAPSDNWLQVVVSPLVFEQMRLSSGLDLLYDVRFWLAMANAHSELATVEAVPLGGASHAI